MDKRQKGQWAMLGRVHTHVKEHLRFEEGGEVSRALDIVGDALHEINAFNGEKQTARRVSRTAKLVAKRALVTRLTAIAGAARVLAKTVPDADAKFPLPAGRSDVAVLQAGLLFRKEAEPVKADFVRCGLPPTFLDDLQQAITSFEQSIAGRDAGKTGSKVSQFAIRDALRRGLDAVRSLDVLVNIALGNNPKAMEAWKSERRIEAKPSAVSATSESQVTPDAPSASGADDPALKEAS